MLTSKDFPANYLRKNSKCVVQRRTSVNWQTWQTGFLFVFSMQFDSEKPDKITGGACACNDDKVIFENPLIYSAAVFRVPGMN